MFLLTNSLLALKITKLESLFRLKFFFLIDEENAKKITEVYTYEWTDDEI